MLKRAVVFQNCHRFLIFGAAEICDIRFKAGLEDRGDVMLETDTLSMEASARPAHARTAAEVAEELNTDLVRGLSNPQVSQLAAQFGPNQLREAPPPSVLKRLAAQFQELVIWLLIAAAIVSGAMGEWTDTIVIVAIVILNGLLGFFQERRADRAMAALQKLSSPRARVIRDGQAAAVDASQLVPGDLVELEAGDFVPADLRLTHSAALQIEEAALTGESNSVLKEPAAVLDAQTALGDRVNLAFTGTTVTAGKGSGIVTSIGMNTELGRIAGMLQHHEPQPTPLQQQLTRFGKMLVIACVIIVAVIFTIQILRGMPIQTAFLLAVSLAVAAVPEGLPAVVTIALALGLGRMARRHALIRKLPSVETLGSVTLICTDKTGTLTRNQMTARRIYVGGADYDVSGVGYEPVGDFKRRGSDGNSAEPLSADLLHALTIGAMANYARLEAPSDGTSTWHITGDPTEAALLVAAKKAGIRIAHRDEDLLYEIPFDSTRKRMSVVARTKGGGIMYTKGAPEVVLGLCCNERVGGASRSLTESRRAEIMASSSQMAGEALRVLALAYREYPNVWPEHCVEEELVFAGLVGLLDPARPEAEEAVEKCYRAGIRPVMITGDHPDTALAIARELKIQSENSQVLSGRQLDALSEQELLDAVDRTNVYARVTAEHKMRIIRAARRRGHVVAMTGDGVNDAPAIKIADVGIAMGKGGTDVAREAADMVLTDDNFASIVAAVEEGRGIFANIRKFIHYLLGCNTGEVLFMLFGTLAGWSVPLTAIQILWINLVTDALPALALALEPPEPDIMEKPPRRRDEPIIPAKLGARMLVHGAMIAAVTAIGFGLMLHDAPGNLIRAQTVAFCILSYTQLFYSLSCRSQRYTMPELGLLSNKHLLGAIVISGLLQTAVFLPWLDRLFKIESRLGWEWLVIFGLSLLPVTIIEVAKLLRAAIRRRATATTTPSSR